MRYFILPPWPVFPQEIMIWSNFNLNNLCFYINNLSFHGDAVPQLPAFLVNIVIFLYIFQWKKHHLPCGPTLSLPSLG